MFTGIIESVGSVEATRLEGTNCHFRIQSDISQELKVDQSVSHDGVCLTVTKVEGKTHWVTAVEETLSRSNLSAWATGYRINLERCMRADGRFDGHIVQGHVDQTGLVKSITDRNGSWLFEFSYESVHGHQTVEKGSISINGVSLTCFDSTNDGFTVAVIPYTFEHTNFGDLRQGDVVNLEFDIIGKYVRKVLNRS